MNDTTILVDIGFRTNKQMVKEVGYFRWWIQLGRFTFAWVNRGTILDGYFILRGKRTHISWPRSKGVQKAGITGPWWKPWRI